MSIEQLEMKSLQGLTDQNLNNMKSLTEEQVNKIKSMSIEDILTNFDHMQEALLTQDKNVGEANARISNLDKELDNAYNKLLKANAEINRLNSLLIDIHEISRDSNE